MRNISEADSVIDLSDQMQDIGFIDDSDVYTFIRHLLCAFAVLGTLLDIGQWGIGLNTAGFLP